MLEENIYYAYLDARQHKRGTRSQVLFEMHLEDNLTGLCRELRDGTYKLGRSMCFIIRDPVQREVFAASFRDRIVHHLIHNDRHFLKSTIVSIRRFLDRVLHLTLHPNKIYLQNVRNGVSFVGAFIKPYRRYVSHRTAATVSALT